MTLNEIRQKTGYYENAKVSLKQHVRTWLVSSARTEYQIGITLMPKKVIVKHLPNSHNSKKKYAYRELNKNELKQATERFIAKLNELVFKNAYKRFGKKLNSIASIEGEMSYKDLHIHLAVGGKPDYMKYNELAKLIVKAINLSDDFQTINENYKIGVDDVSKQYRYKIDVIDSGWMEYITKELPRNSMDNLLL